jgi:aspartyl-tRNA(Asn)/glutamyl-tRNA(Gln) amidotransferase subunit A
MSGSAFDNYFLQAQKVRRLISADFDRVFSIPNMLSPRLPDKNLDDLVDVLIHPSAIRTAPPLADPIVGLQSYVQDVLTVPASLAGLPALNVTAGLAEDGWPVGLSIVGQWGCEEMVLRVGQIIEKLND